jgi:hypothetical protein
MAISIGQRDEYVEGIPRQRKKIVWVWAFTAEARHGPSLPVRAIAINGVVSSRTGGSRKGGRLAATSHRWRLDLVNVWLSTKRTQPHPRWLAGNRRFGATSSVGSNEFWLTPDVSHRRERTSASRGPLSWVFAERAVSRRLCVSPPKRLFTSQVFRIRAAATSAPLVLRDAIEVFSTAEVEFVADHHWGSVETVVELVKGQQLELRAARDDGDAAFAPGDVYASGSAYG